MLTLAHPQRHFDIVTSEDVAEFPELFGAIGDAYFARRMSDEALNVYLQLTDNEEVRPLFHPRPSQALVD